MKTSILFPSQQLLRKILENIIILRNEQKEEYYSLNVSELSLKDRVRLNNIIPAQVQSVKLRSKKPVLSARQALENFQERVSVQEIFSSAFMSPLAQTASVLCFSRISEAIYCPERLKPPEKLKELSEEITEAFCTYAHLMSQDVINAFDLLFEMQLVIPASYRVLLENAMNGYVAELEERNSKEFISIPETTGYLEEYLSELQIGEENMSLEQTCFLSWVKKEKKTKNKYIPLFECLFLMKEKVWQIHSIHQFQIQLCSTSGNREWHESTSIPVWKKNLLRNPY